MIPQIRFSNNSGTVQISGGINPLLSLIDVSGLSMPEKEESYAVFKNVAGRKLISARDKARVIAIEGITEKSAEYIASIMYLPGTLSIQTDRMARVISARCTHLSDRTADNKIKLIFQCDSPYFHDETDLNVSVYSRIEQVKTPFTLPMVFTKRIREGNCKNLSTVKCEPEIIIRNMGKNPIEGFLITNTDTGAEIEMSAIVNPDEKIKIDIKGRTVMSDTGENLLPYLAETCYLHEFYLSPGDNRIILTAEDGLECEVIYNTNYSEAVI